MWSLASLGTFETAAAERLRAPLAVALVIGTLVQAKLRAGPAGLTLTLSDAVVAGVLPFLVLAFARGHSFAVTGAVPRLAAWLALATVALVVAFFVGYAHVGLQGWAIMRLVGWGAVLSHLAVAAWIASDDAVRRLALKVFVLAAAGVVVVDVVQILAATVFVGPDDCGWGAAATGLSANPNAYAFMLLMGLAAAACQAPSGLFGGRTLSAVVVATLVLALALTSSRSGWAAAGAVSLVILALGWTRRLPFVIGAAVGLALAALLVSGWVCPAKTAVAVDVRALGNIANEPATIDAFMEERVYSQRRAIELFLAHPLFGAGLGTFLATELAAGLDALIIHSTPLWLLAETGLAGAGAFAALALAVVVALVRQLRDGPSGVKTDARTALMLMLAFAIMSLAQELLFQRSLWVLLGLAVFRPSGTAPAARA
jgi:hypothetical protein